MMPTASHHESERTSLPLHKPGTLGVVCMPFGQSCKDASLVIHMVSVGSQIVTVTSFLTLLEISLIAPIIIAAVIIPSLSSS